ncbi:cytochrome b/b6 domain-containing protein [soil metagenome]
MTRVWDPLVRIFHWSLVLSFASAWITSDWRSDAHIWAGYAAAALICVRLLWGFQGTPYARFAQFVRSPRQVAKYLLAILKHCEARYIGHNPAGGAMVLALLAGLAATAATGWMMTTDAYFGEDWVQTVHSVCAHGVLALILVHVAGVALASVRHRENLVAAMVTGQKRKPAAGDIA